MKKERVNILGTWGSKKWPRWQVDLRYHAHIFSHLNQVQYYLHLAKFVVIINWIRNINIILNKRMLKVWKETKNWDLSESLLCCYSSVP